MFHNAFARQGSSFCNRAGSNLQAFALCDMKIGAHEGCRVGQKMSCHFSFCQLNSACTRKSLDVRFNVSEL